MGLNAVIAWIAENAIALVALLVSFAALASQFFRGRRANLSSHLATTPEYRGKANRLVIVNHGPAAAKAIEIQMTTPSGDEWQPISTDGDPFPIQELAAGSAFYMPIHVVVGTGPYVMVRLTWKDRRSGRQVWTSAVSTTGQPLGGGQISGGLDTGKPARFQDRLGTPAI